MIYRHRQGLDLTRTTKIVVPKPVVEREVEYESVVVAFEDDQYSRDAMATPELEAQDVPQTPEIKARVDKELELLATEPPQHRTQFARPRNAPKPLRVKAVQADRHPVEPGILERLSQALHQHPIGRQRQVLNPLNAAEHANKINQPMPNRWLPAR